MLEIAARLRQRYEGEFKPGREYPVAAGSGETIICLALAFPDCDFIPVYNNLCPATQRDPGAPLGAFVRAFFNPITVDADNQ